MATRDGTFYSPWPIISGKNLQFQWGEIRSNQAELKAIVRNSVQELEDDVDELNAARALLGQAYGDLAFRNRWRFFYDKTTEEILCQTNDGSVEVPVWRDAWQVRQHDGQFQVVSTGGIFSSAGFYTNDDSLQTIQEIGESGSEADVSILNPSRLFFNTDDGFGVAPISSGTNQGQREVTLTRPFGRAQSFTRAGKMWAINHGFGITPVLAQVMDADDRIVIPDKADVSDPNTAYFYFNAPFTGSVYIASGGLGATSLRPRDPFYLVVRVDGMAAADRVLEPNADLVFDSKYFYVNVDLDADNGGARKSARVSLTDKATSGSRVLLGVDDQTNVGVLRVNTLGWDALYSHVEIEFIGIRPQATDTFMEIAPMVGISGSSTGSTNQMVTQGGFVSAAEESGWSTSQTHLIGPNARNALNGRAKFTRFGGGHLSGEASFSYQNAGADGRGSSCFFHPRATVYPSFDGFEVTLGSGNITGKIKVYGVY